jgi:CDP-glucose 4,6-dehydratase
MCNYYIGRRILITGHTGFKGSWLTHWLKLLGAEVCGIALAPDTVPSMFELIHGADNILSHQFDVSDAGATQRVFRAFQPEIVFHLAAQSLVRRSYQRPWDTFMSNVMGTASVLEAARSVSSVRAIVVVTSDKVYKNRGTGNAFVESDQLGGDDPYSASKACTELVTESWRTSFFHSGNAARVASARAGNVFGGGDWCADRLLPDIVRAVSADQPVVLRNPTAVRPWQYVLEALSGYLMLGVRLAMGDAGFSEGWNFGPQSSEAIDVADFAQRVVRIWGKGSVVLRPDPGAPKEAHTLRLDSAKSMHRLGWKAVLPLEDAIDWSVGWYREVLASPSRAAEITTSQIKAFSERLERAGVGRPAFEKYSVQ